MCSCLQKLLRRMPQDGRCLKNNCLFWNKNPLYLFVC
jgi:hypothetical protein